MNAKAILAAPFVKAGAFLAAPFVKVGAKKIALIMKGGVVVGAKLLKGAALKTKVAATKAGLGAALLGKKAVIFGSGAALKGGLATGLATAAGAPLVLVPAAAASAAAKFFPQLNVPGLNNLGASIQDQLENFNLFKVEMFDATETVILCLIVAVVSEQKTSKKSNKLQLFFHSF